MGGKRHKCRRASLRNVEESGGGGVGMVSSVQDGIRMGRCLDLYRVVKEGSSVTEEKEGSSVAGCLGILHLPLAESQPMVRHLCLHFSWHDPRRHDPTEMADGSTVVTFVDPVNA